MPVYPTNTICSELGCKELRTRLNSFCLKHGGKDYTIKESDSVYKSKAWQAIRRTQLSRQPLCQSCLSRGIVCAALHIDHVFPWQRIRGNAFTHNIFQSLCPECHTYKTGQEKQGKYEHYHANGVRVYSDADYALVVMNEERT